MQKHKKINTPMLRKPNSTFARGGYFWWSFLSPPSDIWRWHRFYLIVRYIPQWLCTSREEIVTIAGLVTF